MFGAEIELSKPEATYQWQGKDVPLTLPGKKLKGYVLLAAIDANGGQFDPASTEARSLFQRNGLFFVPAASIFQIERPERAVVTTFEHGDLMLSPSNVVRIKKWAGPFNGHHAYAQPFVMSQDHIGLLKSGKLVYSCVARYAFVEGTYWMSFNPKIGKEELAPVCEGDYQRPAPTADIKELESKLDVFIVKFPTD